MIAAALSLTACTSGGDAGAAKTSSPAPVSAAPSHAAPTAPSHAAPAAASHTPTAPSASRPAGGGTSTAPGAPASPVSGTPAGTTPTCPLTAVAATAYQAAVRPDGTGTGAAIVEFTNTSGHTCVLRGHPTVATAGNGSPEHNSPLKVTPTGIASAVPLAPGGKAWVKLTFHQVQGEADGYCVSGAKPVVSPTLVVGLPGSGAHQVALSDGEFAECDNTVTATAVSAAKPS
ncbi:hypothetical protein GCM10010339_45800 [Streptomyces alanosinicus]|uniref:DUF4232 domain-containing protein n=1 Tax=Streptomyces alanosinicus TaxID=68171 RepID=A0A918YJN0_9ACTN|nr:hypothetical protein GCM10010339_45800 [Streptomyces alanosinicus]